MRVGIAVGLSRLDGRVDASGNWIDRALVTGHTWRPVVVALTWFVLMLLGAFLAASSPVGVALLALLAALGSTGALYRGLAYRNGWLEGRVAARRSLQDATSRGSSEEQWLTEELTRDAKVMAQATR